MAIRFMKLPSHENISRSEDKFVRKESNNVAVSLRI